MLSAVDSLLHGLQNVRANWQLLVVLFAQTLMTSVLTILGGVPIFLVLGVAVVRGIAAQFGTVGPIALWERFFEAGMPLLFALLAATLIWTLAFVVYCYFQGGILGTLAAGERRVRVQKPGWQDFQVFSWQSFARSAEQLTWPVFWLLNLFLVVATAVLALFALLAAGLFLVLQESSVSLRVVLGCSIFLLVVVVLALTAAWMQLALAQLAGGVRGVLNAARSALTVARRRFPGVALLFLVLIAGSVFVGIVLVPLSVVVESAARGDFMAYWGGQVLVTVAQWFASSIVTLAWSAALIALVAGDSEAIGAVVAR